MSILSNRVERLEAKAGPVDIKVFIISFISPEHAQMKSAEAGGQRFHRTGDETEEQFLARVKAFAVGSCTPGRPAMIFLSR
jgi:hypothetical protein